MDTSHTIYSKIMDAVRLQLPNARFGNNISNAANEDAQNLLGCIFGLTFPIVLNFQNQPDCPTEFRAIKSFLATAGWHYYAAINTLKIPAFTGL